MATLLRISCQETVFHEQPPWNKRGKRTTKNPAHWWGRQVLSPIRVNTTLLWGSIATSLPALVASIAYWKSAVSNRSTRKKAGTINSYFLWLSYFYRICLFKKKGSFPGRRSRKRGKVADKTLGRARCVVTAGRNRTWLSIKPFRLSVRRYIWGITSLWR